MINNDGIKDKDNSLLESADDDYDFMASLMDDVMGSNKSDVDDNTTDDLSAPELTSADTVPEVDIDESVIEDEVVEPVSRKKRVPLFAQMGIGVDDISSPEPTSKIEEGLDKEEVIDDIYHEEDREYEETTYTNTYEGDTDSVVDTETKIQIPEEIVEAVDGEPDNFMDDLLSGMLEGNEEDVEIVEDEYVSTVKVPLETKAMRDTKVTADGRTLAEMLPSMRGGRKSVNEIVAEIKNDETVVDVNGKKFSDDRYAEHVKVINDERAEQDKRRALSKKFLQRNAKFSTEERIIMENLGVSNKQFANLMKSTELTPEQKEEVLGLGRYGAEKHFKGRRYRTTVGDTAMLEFLVKFKFANTRILRWISDEPQSRTWRKLDRLRDNGLVESQTLIGIPDLWAATSAGVAISGYDYAPGLRPTPKMITVSSSMGINYVAACLWFNTVNVLNLDDFPAHNRIIALQDDGRDRVRGEMLVSELELRSSLGKEINPNSTTMQTLGDERLYDVISSNVREEISAWRQGGRVGISPEMQIGNEYMWILFPTSQLTLSYHVPDLVVQRERGPNGEPNSIAVEMERYEKSNTRYDQIMLAYKLDDHLYKEVVWITPSARVARELEQAAQRVGFDNYRIIPIITEFGTYSKPDIWMI